MLFELRLIESKLFHSEIIDLKKTTEKFNKLHLTLALNYGSRNEILNEAFAKDPEFFEFIRSMEAYADTFKDGTTTMVISPDSDFFEYFENSEGAN